MNTQLVDSLVQIIQSLPKEERALLNEKLQESDGGDTLLRIRKLRSEINAARDGKPFDPPIEEIIYQMREERDRQILSACFPQLFPDESSSVG